MNSRKDSHRFRRQPASDGLWLYGLHAVRAALANPRRKVLRAVLTARAAEEIGAKLLGRMRHEIADGDAITRLLPPGAVHQGAALQCEKLPKLDLENVLTPSQSASVFAHGASADNPRSDLSLSGGGKDRRIVLVLDQISDPHNTGAILRSAAAFGVSAVIVQDRHAPPESGALAKSASGALDIVPYVEVVNIARVLDELGELGFWRVALVGDGEQSLKDAVSTGDVALVLGSEGSGVRRLVRERCDAQAFIAIDAQMESLNVSNAAAIALYEIRRN
jgi:23S rRNA (guanosine2251-2'-O)-methyltransferase